MKLNRWHIFNYLKGNSALKLSAEDIEQTSLEEVKEGFLEYFLLKEKEEELKNRKKDN